MATAITGYMQSTIKLTNDASSSTESHPSSRNNSSNSSKNSCAGPSSKHPKGRAHRSSQQAAVDASKLSAAAQVCHELLRLWVRMQQKFTVSPRTDADAQRHVFVLSSMDLAPTVTPVSHLILATLRYYIEYSSIATSKNFVHQEKMATALTVAAVVNYRLANHIHCHNQQPCSTSTAALHEVLQSQHVQELLLFLLASNIYLIWNKQHGRSKVTVPRHLIPAAAAADGNTTIFDSTQSKRSQEKVQQLVLNIKDHHKQLLQLLGWSKITPASFRLPIPPWANSKLKAACDHPAVDIVQIAASNLCHSISMDFKLPLSQQQHDMSAADRASLCSVLQQVLLQLLLLNPDEESVRQAAICLCLTSVVFKLHYSATLTTADLTAAVRGMLAPMMLQGVFMLQHASKALEALGADEQLQLEQLFPRLLRETLDQGTRLTNPMPSTCLFSKVHMLEGI